MTNIRAILGKNIRKFRNLKGWSQLHLAEECNLSNVFITELERGRKYPSARTIESLCDVFGVRPYQLFLDDGDLEEIRSELVTDSLADRFEAKMDKILEKKEK